MTTSPASETPRPVTVPTLQDRARVLAPLGWSGRAAEWIALVALHTGVFTRSQWCHFFDHANREAARVFVRALIDKQLAIEDERAIFPGGAPATARVTLVDKGLVPLTVSFAQAAYIVTEGGEAVRIDVALAPAADRRVTVPLEVTWPRGPARADVTGVPAAIVFDVGMAAATLAVTVPADQAQTTDERLVLRFGALPPAVRAGAVAATTVTVLQARSAAAFERSMAVTLAVTARAVAESAQSAITARFERYR